MLFGQDLVDSVGTIDQLEDCEYISDINIRLGIRYKYPPEIKLDLLKGGGTSGITNCCEPKT